MQDDRLSAAIATALRLSPEKAGSIELTSCGRGGNNRVYIATVDGRKVVVKEYFRHPEDSRDRLGAEQAFLAYCGGSGIACVPALVAADPDGGIGVYEFIDGTPPETADIDVSRIGEAERFFLQLNDLRRRESARALPQASEACFTIERHFAMVDRRIGRLSGITGGHGEREARAVVDELRSCWGDAKDRIARAASRSGASLDAEVEERCVSPSDFGFHNTLVRPSGELCFLDFEYAGWDDPAKMAGDFFSHPGVLVPRRHFDGFLKRTMAFSPHAAALEERARLLLPVFQVKWCCIVLNDFVPESAQRRRFADPAADEAARRQAQLGKARRLLDEIARRAS